MESKKILIFGILGQDGSYLSEYLIKNGFKVIGAYKTLTKQNKWRLTNLNIYNKITLKKVDITKKNQVFNIIKELKPDKIFNLTATGYQNLENINLLNTINVNFIGVKNILESITTLGRDISFFQASTSEMYEILQSSQNRKISNDNIYGESKLFSHLLCKHYKNNLGVDVKCGILFNHESPMRDIRYITRKITFYLSNYKINQNQGFEIGNPNIKKDWGYAKEYTRAMWKVLNHGKKFDYEIGTGKLTSIKKFINICSVNLNLKTIWQGEDKKLTLIDKKNNFKIIKINNKYYRNNKNNFSKANLYEIKKDTNWYPKINIEKLSEIMIKADYDLLRKNN